MTQPPAPPSPPAYGPPPGAYGPPPGGYGPPPGGYGPPPGGYGPPPGGYGPPPGGYGPVPDPPPPVPTERPRTPWWAGLLAVLGVLAVVATLVGVTSALVYAAATRTSEVAVAETGVRELRLTGVAGGASVTTRTSSDGEVMGTARLTTSWDEADVTVERQGDVLLLEADCDQQAWPRRCEVAFDLVVDPSTDVVVDMVTGGFEADGLSGDVAVDMVTGGVMLTAAASQQVDVQVTTGGVALDFAVAPRQVEVSTVTGGIAIGLPVDGQAYAVSTDVSVGGSDVSVPTDPSSSRSIEASTTVGGIEVRNGPVDVTGSQTTWDGSGWGGGAPARPDRPTP
ncbi:hypothetical protein [Aquipuribacter sp. MA13-6]|uniref:hypothetical protein n=1 Tax=unclassified Aquipuribacter TaxID=2635084 RepID=UPI003EEF58EC